MKRSKFMIGALVLSMGLLGVGYASWTDMLEVNATVSTGNLDVRWENTDKQVRGEQEVTYDIEIDDQENNDDLAYNNEDDKLIITAENLSPGEQIVYTVDVVNEGTLKAKLEEIGLTGTLTDKSDADADVDLAKFLEGVEININAKKGDTPIAQHTVTKADFVAGEITTFNGRELAGKVIETTEGGTTEKKDSVTLEITVNVTGDNPVEVQNKQIKLELACNWVQATK